jgi:hypothetical protein
LNAVIGNPKEVVEVLVGEKSTEEGTIITVGGRAAESYQADQNQEGRAEDMRGLLYLGLLEGLITNDDLGGGDLSLLLKL